MKEGSKAVKVVSKKKVNHYTIQDCKNELERLNSSHKDKDGFVMGDSSKYKKDVQERLNSL